jgi:hypothetical protein
VEQLQRKQEALERDMTAIEGKLKVQTTTWPFKYYTYFSVELSNGVFRLTLLALWIWNNSALQRLRFKWSPVILNFLSQQI